MKKRLLSVLLCFVLAAALLPATVFAEEELTIVTTEAELTDAAAKGGSIQLAADITIHSTLKISGTVTLDLNGYVLNYESDTDGSVIEVEGNSELTLEDSRPDAEHKFKVNDDGLWVLDEKKGTKTISGGVITGGHAANGGGIMVGKTTLTMNGGNIVGCSAYNGGAVYLTKDKRDIKWNTHNYAKFFMYGGRLCGCSAVSGGAVFISGAADDETSVHGLVWTSLFDMRGGTIENCAAKSGSGVYAPLYGIFKMSGGEIKNCTGDEWTVYNNNGDFSLTGGAIYGNIKYVSNGNQGIIPTVKFAAGVTVYGRLNLPKDERYVKGELPELIYFYTEQGPEGKDDIVYAIQVLNLETPQPAEKIKDPTKAGYKFEGWYDDWNYEDRYSGFDEDVWAKSCGDGYAKWTEKSNYTVKFDTAGSDAIDEKTGIRWTDTVLDGISEPEKSGYTFAGWKCGNAKVTESTTYAELVPNDDAENDTITIKAQWNAIDRDDPIYYITVNKAENGTVASSRRYAERGERVTLTIEPDKGWTLETLTAATAAGKKIDLSIVEAGEEYTFTMPDGDVTVTATFMEDNSMLNYFIDVNARDYFYDSVLWAAKNGITSGTDDSHFSPNGSCTRAQAVTFLWRAAGSPAPKSTAMPFTDVPSGAYYETAVLWAVENGITKGTSDTAFSPDATCSRAQIVTFLYRSEQASGNGMNGTWAFQNPFTDVNTADYYGEAVMWAVANDVTEGTTSTTFSPDNNCTRAQIVTFIYRAISE